MAIIKAVSSHAPINTVINYVCQREKTELKLMSGIGCTPETAADEMQATKLLYRKTRGRTYKHFVQSFAPEETLNAETAHQIAREFAMQCPLFQGFEVLAVTHQDREHFHTHFVVNSVSYEDGHKFQMKSTELQDMKDLSDDICLQFGLSICAKGLTFDGQERDDTTSYRKETYQLLKQAENGEVQSYIQNIALAILDCRDIAVSREDFVVRMYNRGIEVNWSDNRKYITFTDIERREHGETKCKVRNSRLEKYYHMDFSKEGMIHEFKENARRAETEKSAAEQLKREVDRAADAADCGIRTDYGRAERDMEGERKTQEREQQLAKQAVRSRTKSRGFEPEI